MDAKSSYNKDDDLEMGLGERFFPENARNSAQKIGIWYIMKMWGISQYNDYPGCFRNA